MRNDTNPELQDILNLLDDIPVYEDFNSNITNTLTYLHQWLKHFSRIYDVSRGFNVNRCALYWAGYDAVDGFDGQAFVETCQDSKGSLKALAEILDTDLQIFELDPNNFERPDENSLALAASYGMMAIEESTQLFSACSFGQGVETAATDALHHLNLIDGHIDLNGFIVKHCGLDHAAMIGAVIASCLKGIPVILEGASGTLVKTILQKATSRQWSGIILTDDFDDFAVRHEPGHKMIQTAIILKTLYISSNRSDCGKIQKAA